MDISSIMTADIVSAQPEESVGAAVELLEDQLIRHLPVVENDRLLGMISDRDLREYRLPIDVAIENPKQAQRLLATPLRDVMASSVVTAAPGDSVESVVDRMLQHDLGALPVVDVHGQLLGVISYVDVLQWVRDRKGAAG